MLVGLAAYQATAVGRRTRHDAASALLFYLFAYAFMNIGAFAVVTWLQHRGHGTDARRLRAASASARRWPRRR